MDITCLGHSSFRIKTKSASIITDPFDSEMVGLKFPQVEAELVTISHDHKDHNAIGKVTGVKKVINGPGEYEISGVSVVGFQSFHDGKNGSERGKNTIYVIEADGLRLCHLGDLGHTLGEDLVQAIGDVDVLMIPVGGEFTIGPKEAVEIVNDMEPFYVLPMHYKVPGMSAQFDKLSSVDAFLKESGFSVENLPKFSIKKEDIEADQNTKVIVLSARN